MARVHHKTRFHAKATGKAKRDDRILADDALHYRRFVTAMQLTVPEMAAVDATIARHSGWPGTFTEGG